MPRLTLYRKDGACSIAAHMLLLHLQIPFTAIPMVEGPDRLYQPAEGTNLNRADFLNISPMGYVPALTIDGDNTITELSAVLFYISSLAPERGTTGHGPLEAAKVLQWMSWLSTTLNEYGFAGYWRPSRMVGFEASLEAEEAVRSEGGKTILKGFGILEGWLDGTGFAVGGHLTVVDFMLQ